MGIRSKRMLVLLVFLQAFLPSRVAMADVGPKPSMEFTFTQEFPGDQVTLLDGTLFECEQSDCSDASPLAEMGPQSFGCSPNPNSCSAMAYGFSTYHRLEIEFSDDKTRRSNIFQTGEFNGTYAVTIRQDDLLVEPQLTTDAYPRWIYIVLCAGCLSAVVVVVIIILIVRRAAKRK